MFAGVFSSPRLFKIFRSIISSSSTNPLSLVRIVYLFRAFDTHVLIPPSVSVTNSVFLFISWIGHLRLSVPLIKALPGFITAGTPTLGF